MKDNRECPCYIALRVFAVLMLVSVAALAVIKWWDEITDAFLQLKEKWCHLVKADGESDYEDYDEVFGEDR